MEESWKMRMGTNLPRRRSTSTCRRSLERLHPDDFSDVFGGPPRSVMTRKYSGDFSATNSSFYEEIFRPSEFVSRSNSSAGRSLPAFRIPARGERFYSDIFGDVGWRRSRDRSRACSKSKSKSNSSSVLSSEELSPHRRWCGDDVASNSFASKLRPKNAGCRWNSSSMRSQEVQRKQKMTSFPYIPAENVPIDSEWSEDFESSCHRSFRNFSSPETISIEPNSFRSVKISVDDLEQNYLSSPASSLCEEPLPESKSSWMQFMEQDEDEVMSSYVIEINSDHREGNVEALSIDDAIAWAKEKYHSAEASERASSQELTQHSGHGGTPSTPEELEKWKPEEVKRSEKEIEMEMMDEDIKTWSSGKETNIRFLLSTLHHILWTNSGWHAIPITTLIESSNVKKAYQKARLRLHPDKLQQRGASASQKYVAEKAFSILQDAWAAFVSQDVLF